jgi:hypothetical protein
MMNKVKIQEHFNYEDFAKQLEGKEGNPEESKGDQPKDEKESLFTAFRITGLAKVPGIIEFLSTLIENNVKFILFAHHTQVLDDLETYIRK